MFQVLHSSAGAGKTHALVKHYLGLCLAGGDPSAYRKVLALTFTNKAAGEMKERVIDYLKELAKNEVHDARIADVMDHLVATSKADRNVIAQRANACLEHMLHHWSNVAIGTIDGFTRKVVRPFARDLQLDHDLHMTTEEEYYRDLAVDKLIAEVGVDERITTLLTEVCLQLLHEERKWDPERPLKELSCELSKESSIAPLEQLRKFPPGQLKPLADRLRSEEVILRRKVNDLGKQALLVLEEAGVAPEDLSYGKNGIYSYFRKLSAFSDLWDPPGSNTLKTIETGKWNSGKAAPAVISSIHSITGELLKIYDTAEQLREEDHRRYVVRRAVARELLPAFALHELDLRLEQVKQSDAVAFFSDLTRMVSQVVMDEPVPFIFERLGERYRHFLIDEFQDTSMQQWNALLPLIDNALGSGGSALLVGDAKQAIYRWRNGEVRLFVELPKLFGKTEDTIASERERTLIRNYKKAERLEHNYRSAGTIIEFNNNLFTALKQQLPEHLQPVYNDHEQLVIKNDPGFVLIEKLPKEITGEERNEEMLRFTLQAVKDSIEDGFAPGDIAVLVRSRSLGRTIAAELVARGHAVVSPDGLQLSGDPVIELLIDMLRFLHTADPEAAARIAQYQAIVSAEKEATGIGLGGEGEELPDPIALLRSWLKEKGSPRLRTTLSALIGELAHALGLQPSADAQLLTLLDEAFTWSTDHGQDIGGFLEHWERAGENRSVDPPDNGQAIQVMTIHRSKGLQFPVVIVPNTCMSSKGDLGDRIWIAPGDAVPELNVALVRSGKALRELELPELEEEAALSVLDSLDLLYVAFTRPEQRLYAKVHEYGADGITRELLRFLEANAGDRLIDGERTGPWKKRRSLEMEFLKEVTDGSTGSPIAVRFEAPREWDPADPDPFRSHGDLVHDLLARVIGARDLVTTLKKAVLQGELSEEMAAALEEKLLPMITSEDLAPWFKPGLIVRSERTIITSKGNALRPDRVVIEGDVVRVLDIKTGKPYEEHVEQVAGYMQRLKELTGLKVEGALLYVRDGALQQIDADGIGVLSEAF